MREYLGYFEPKRAGYYENSEFTESTFLVHHTKG
jgi:hypothetical protein